MYISSKNKAFTLIELLVVIAIIGILSSVILISINVARAKGEDARRKSAIKNIQSEIAIQADSAASDYSTIFAFGSSAKAKLDQLASQAGVPSESYDTLADQSSYVLTFPLKAGSSKYWCIDSLGNSKEINGRINASGPKSCANASIGNAPTITIYDDPIIDVRMVCGVWQEPNIVSSGYAEGSDVEDGILDVTMGTPQYVKSGNQTTSGTVQYSTTDSDGNTATVATSMVVTYHYLNMGCGF